MEVIVRTKHRLSGSLHSYQLDAVDAHLHHIEFALRSVNLDLLDLGDRNIIVEPPSSCFIWPQTSVCTLWRDLTLDIASGRVKLDQSSLPQADHLSESDARALLTSTFRKSPCSYRFQVIINNLQLCFHQIALGKPLYLSKNEINHYFLHF